MSVLNIPKKSQSWCLKNSYEGQNSKGIYMRHLVYYFHFSYEVMDLDADDAKDSVPLSPSSPAADSPAKTEIINPVSKKNVTVKKTAAKGEPKSLRWVNIGIN